MWREDPAKTLRCFNTSDIFLAQGTRRHALSMRCNEPAQTIQHKTPKPSAASGEGCPIVYQETCETMEESREKAQELVHL